MVQIIKLPEEIREYKRKGKYLGKINEMAAYFLFQLDVEEGQILIDIGSEEYGYVEIT